MPDYNQLPDGEYFVDTAATTAVPHADTWETLSINQLIETKNTLTNQYFAFQNNPVVGKTLSTSIMRLDQLIARRLANS